MPLNALLVDENSAHTRALQELLKQHEFETTCLTSEAEIHALSASEQFEVAVINLETNGVSCLELLDHPSIDGAEEVLLMNDVDMPQTVNRGIAQGATYFFCKPFDEGFLSALLSDIASEAVTRKRDEPGEHKQVDQFGLLRGSSPAMLKLYRTIRKVAQSPTSVLIVGESGTGKELVAQTLHMLGDRSSAPMIAMNCAAIPKELFESELFGHEKGSFSGAIGRHEGFFEQANDGTLFLDEITEMPVDLQAKLLRVLETGTFRRVGGTTELETNARIVAATNREPDLAIEEGELREDLYYRVAGFPLFLPPLRARGEDKVGLASYFLHALNQEHNRSVYLTRSAIAKIDGHSWPGNVRELKSTVERAFILAERAIDAATLGPMSQPVISSDPSTVSIPLDATIEDAERALIEAVLAANGEDKPAAAESLGISLKTLYNRLNRYDDAAQ